MGMGEGKQSENGVLPMRRTVPGGVVVLTALPDRVKAYFHPGIATLCNVMEIKEEKKGKEYGKHSILEDE
jgi:hypothetical protein